MPSKPPPSDDVHTAKVAVHEITAALPDMICVELRDPPLRFGKLYHKADGPIFEGAYAVVNCVASPSGAIRVICRGGPFAPWFFDEGNSAPLLFWGIGGVPSANGLFEGHKVDSNTIDLIDTTFSGSYTSGGHFRQFFGSGYGTRLRTMRGDGSAVAMVTISGRRIPDLKSTSTVP